MFLDYVCTISEIQIAWKSSGFLETIHAMNEKSFHNICLVRVGHSLANFGNPLSTSSLGVTHDVPRKNVVEKNAKTSCMPAANFDDG